MSKRVVKSCWIVVNPEASLFELVTHMNPSVVGLVLMLTPIECSSPSVGLTAITFTVCNASVQGYAPTSDLYVGGIRLNSH